MYQLETLALSAKNYGVIADRVAGANRQHRDFAVRPDSGDSFASIDCVRREICAARRRDRLAERDCSTTRRVDLGPMMYFDHLGIEVGQNRGDLRDDLREHV